MASINPGTDSNRDFFWQCQAELKIRQSRIDLPIGNTTVAEIVHNSYMNVLFLRFRFSNNTSVIFVYLTLMPIVTKPLQIRLFGLNC